MSTQTTNLILRLSCHLLCTCRSQTWFNWRWYLSRIEPYSNILKWCQANKLRTLKALKAKFWCSPPVTTSKGAPRNSSQSCTGTPQKCTPSSQSSLKRCRNSWVDMWDVLTVRGASNVDINGTSFFSKMFQGAFCSNQKASSALPVVQNLKQKVLGDD